MEHSSKMADVTESMHSKFCDCQMGLVGENNFPSKIILGEGKYFPPGKSFPSGEIISPHSLHQ